ncbi:NFS1 [Branchiostoma lanceolatum]|nr:NFS1 [Branchiostoma lanceolatum]
MRKKHFLLEEDCVFLNHGAFGAALKDALDVAMKWQVEVERQPLRFFDRQVLPHLVWVSRRAAQFVGADPRDIALVTNASTGTNAVIKSQKSGPGDVIYCLSVTYGAVKKLLSHVRDETGVTIQEEVVRFPLEGPEQIVSLVRDTLRPGTRLAVFDHIPSNTPFINPLKEMIDICHDRGVPVLVDGAHALGALPINLRSLNPDYYVTNAHKWFCCPKGVALLYVRRDLQETTRPLVVSHGHGAGFNAEFAFPGMKDYSSMLSLPTVLDFWQCVGPERIRTYLHDMVTQAAQLLVEKWNTGLLAPLNMFASMALVQLPPAFHGGAVATYDLAEKIQNQLYHRFNIEVPLKAVQGELYVRISAHIYNDLADYETLGDAILQLKSELQ